MEVVIFGKNKKYINEAIQKHARAMKSSEKKK